MSVLDGPGEGTWSMFAMKVVEERDELRYKLAGEAAHIKSLEGLLVDAARERDEARDRARKACQILIEEIGADGPTNVDAVAEHATVLIRGLRDQVSDLQAAAEESEHQMHMRIRSGYDKTIADCWRAKVAEVEAERDEALADADRRLNASDAMRAALRHLLLSRDASWTGGHDWTEAVDDAVRALGIEGNHDRT